MDRERLELIEAKLRSLKVYERKAAIDELATVDSEFALPLLKGLAKEKDFGLRCLAMMGLNKHLTEESFEFLKQVLEQEQDYSVLAEAANSIYDFGSRAIAPLQKLFDRCDYWLVRHTIVAVLVESDNPQVLLDSAKKAIQAEQTTTKEIAIVALNRLLNTPLKEEAFAIFSQLATDPDWYLRWRTAIALTASSDTRAKKLLAQLQQDEDYRVVAAALTVDS